MPQSTVSWTPANVKLLSTYTVVHMLAEFSTALILFSLLAAGRITGLEIALYSVLAFGGPIVIAALRPRLPEGRLALFGLLILTLGLLAGAIAGWLAVILLGVGSATFHIAAGTATLKLKRRGTGVGIFESSGAIGISVGTSLGYGIWSGVCASAWLVLLAALLVAGGVAVFHWGTANILSTDLNEHMFECPPPNQFLLGVAKSTWFAPALLALMAVSVIRSLAAFAAPQPWKSTVAMVVWASVGALLGRAIGGIVADRWGWLAPAVVGFVGVGLLWGLIGDAPLPGLFGSFFLALPMAPVIMAMVNITRRPSISFGLAQLFQVPAAMIGGLVFSSWLVLVLLLLCGLLLLAALFGRSSDASV